MFYILALLAVLTYGCAAKASNEMEDMSKDVLKSGRGVEIDVKPLPKEK